MLLLGNPDYEAGRDARVDGMVDPSEVAIRRGVRGSCDALQSLRWSRLPHSAEEVQEIAALFRDRESTSLLTEAAANEEQFKRDARGKRVLHLATHGFFLQDRCASAENLGRGIEGLVPIQPPAQEEAAPAADGETSPSQPTVGNNPLLLSGLVLAGANHARDAESEEEDGILTAEEIAALDLRGVDLVALSACNTGLGAVEVGEGVMGLRRAFELAGARTVLMSLWSVSDKETRDWMMAFYRARIAGASVADAVRRASLSALGALREAKRPEHPYLWAGFVAAGDWK